MDRVHYLSYNVETSNYPERKISVRRQQKLPEKECKNVAEPIMYVRDASETLYLIL